MNSLRQFFAAVLLTVGLMGVTFYRTASLHIPDPPPEVSEWGVVMASPPEAQAAIRRIEGKNKVVAKLVRGEINLFEAAARFRYLNSQPADCPSATWLQMEGATAEEKVCRQVICWVEGQLVGRAPDSEVRASIEGLRTALLQHIAEHGGVTLPAWAPAP